MIVQTQTWATWQRSARPCQGQAGSTPASQHPPRARPPPPHSNPRRGARLVRAGRRRGAIDALGAPLLGPGGGSHNNSSPRGRRARALPGPCAAPLVLVLRTAARVRGGGAGMSAGSKAVLGVTLLLSVGTVVAVHLQQQRDREVGVMRRGPGGKGGRGRAPPTRN